MTAPRAVRAALAFDIGSLDPFTMASAGSLAVMRHLHEPLMRRDLVTGEVAPGLLSTAPSSMGDGYLLTTRDDARFHDGRPVTAHDVAASIVSARDADSFFAGQLAFIENARPVAAAAVHLETDAPPWLVAERLCLVHVVPGGSERSGRIGTGPYRLTDVAPEGAALEPFEGYTGRWPGHERLELHTVLSGQERWDRLEAGDFDVAEDVTPPPGRELPGHLRFRAVPGQNMLALLFNCASPPFDLPEVRRAVWQAIDRFEVVHTAPEDHLYLAEAHSLLAGTDPDHVHAMEETLDLAAIRRVLAAAGLAGSSVRMLVSNASWVAAQLPLLAHQFDRVGVTLTAEIGATKDFMYREVPRGDFQLVLTSSDPSALSGDSLFRLAWFLTGKFADESMHWFEPTRVQVAKHLGIAATTGNPNQRKEAIAEAQRLIAKNCPIAPLVHRAQPTAWSSALLGFRPSTTAGLDLIDVRWAEG